MALFGAKFRVVDAIEWCRSTERTAAATKRDIKDAFKTQARLLGKELIDRTPPFGGKTVEKMLLAQGKSLSYRAAEISNEDLSAKKVGERRVEKDIRRVILGVNNPQMPARERPIVAVGQAHPGNAGYDPNRVEFGVLQKCEGRDAARIFATKSGAVYGVDLQRFMPNASRTDLEKTHEAHRGKRGRVTTAGAKDRIVGRWRWLDILVTKEKALAEYIAEKKKAVGQGKGGWASSVIELGGRVPRWIARHLKAGRCEIKETPNSINIVMTNHSRWASSGDDERIIEKSLERRVENMELNIAGIIEGRHKAK